MEGGGAARGGPHHRRESLPARRLHHLRARRARHPRRGPQRLPGTTGHDPEAHLPPARHRPGGVNMTADQWGESARKAGSFRPVARSHERRAADDRGILVVRAGYAKASANRIDRDVVGAAGPKPGLGQRAAHRSTRKDIGVGTPEYRSALVVGLVGSIAGAGRSSNQAADQRALARAGPAAGNGATGGAEARAEEPPDCPGLGDTPDAITPRGALRGRAGDRNWSRRVGGGSSYFRGYTTPPQRRGAAARGRGLSPGPWP